MRKKHGVFHVMVVDGEVIEGPETQALSKYKE